jgi:hypothetical protein
MSLQRCQGNEAGRVMVTTCQVEHVFGRNGDEHASVLAIAIALSEWRSFSFV